MRVYLGIGTNVGDLAGNVRRTLRALRSLVAVDAVSSVYRSAPFGYGDQPYFWNLAVRARTGYAPRELMSALKTLEREIGRVETFRMGPRIIDLDLLLYGELILDEPDLVIPHAGLLERAFVLRPLLEIEPALRDPRTGAALASAFAELGVQGLTRLGSAEEVAGGSDHATR